MLWLLLALMGPHLAQTSISTQECFIEAAVKYVTCNKVDGRPHFCNCTNYAKCYIKMVIKRERIGSTKSFQYSVNGKFQGPTLLVEEKSIVVVDVFNEMNEDTSIHFHGMHQYNVPWIDGVGNITQFPIPSNGKFR